MNRRQREAWEREALAELRYGDPDNALAAYTENDRIITAEPADEVRERLVGDWWLAREEHGAESGIMIAARRADVDDLNARARGPVPVCVPTCWVAVAG